MGRTTLCGFAGCKRHYRKDTFNEVKKRGVLPQEQLGKDDIIVVPTEKWYLLNPVVTRAATIVLSQNRCLSG